jgi:monofunctional glycosyltransferase
MMIESSVPEFQIKLILWKHFFSLGRGKFYMKQRTRFFALVTILLLLWLLFLLTFKTIYPVADKVEQAAKTEVSQRQSEYLSQYQIPKLFEQAVIQTEDSRFYSHFGVDAIGIIRSIWTDVKAKQLREGGSTITQQLIRNTIISPERTFFRKMKEIILAIALERNMNKDHILELYLNVVYFGHGAYGAEQAADVYFGKSLSALSLPEWSLLAGLPNAPSAYDPFVAMDLAKARQKEVLDNLLNAHIITLSEAETAAHVPIRLMNSQAVTHPS